MLSPRAKILIADDEPDILDSLKIWLEQDGFTVFTAEGPNRAFDEFLQNKPDVVITDIVFKSFSTDKPNGYQLCERIRRFEADSSAESYCILGVMTGVEDSFMPVRAKLDDVDFIIKKPFDGQDLMDRMILAADVRAARNRRDKTNKEAPSIRVDPDGTFKKMVGVILLVMASYLIFQARENGKLDSDVQTLIRQSHDTQEYNDTLVAHIQVLQKLMLQNHISDVPPIPVRPLHDKERQ